MDKIEKLKELQSLLENGVINKDEFDDMKSEILGSSSETKKSDSTIEVVKIGLQEWAKKNLDVSHFWNGDPIPRVDSDREWKEADESGRPAWCYYDNDPINGKTYGKLYNWHAVNDPRGLAPKGWHVPTYSEWKRLIDYVGGEDIAGKKLKAKSGWTNNGNGTDENDFTALPGGNRFSDGDFDRIGNEGYWWSSTEHDTIDAWYRGMGYDYSGVDRGNGLKALGFSVRCLRDI